MSDIEKLSTDPRLPASLRQALQEAGRERPSPELSANVLGALGLGATTAAMAAKTATHAAPIASKLFGATLAGKAAVATAIFVAGGVLGGYAVHAHDMRQAVIAAPAPSTPVSAPARPRQPVETSPVAKPPAPEAPEPTAPPASAEAVARPETPGPRRPVVRPSDVPKTPATPITAPVAEPSAAPEPPALPSSREQLASLRSIRDALAGRRPGDALEAIASHRSRFPSSVFDQELLLLEAQARAARGEPQACALLERFRAQYPTSLLLPRADALSTEAGCRQGTR